MNKEIVKKLTELRKDALKILKEYNALAKKENFGTRVGIIDAVVEDEAFEDYDEGDVIKMNRPKNIGKWITENEYPPDWSTEFPGVKEYAWKPSGINC
jgi:hypothetical protein